jgi:thiamine biosynthesis protein ThiI
MKPNVIVLHHHEIGLKGRNRDFFERVLLRNLRRALDGTGYKRIRRGSGRVTIEFDREGLVAEAAERAARLHGVAYVGVGRRIQPDMDQIAETGLALLRAVPFESFRVRARRTHSSFSQRSQDIHEIVGRHIQEATGAPVDLKGADATVWVELYGGDCVVYRQRLEGHGGLPSGVSGRMVSLLSGGIDSPVAAWRMARRGANVELLHFHGQPYTDHSSVQQSVELAEVLNRHHVETFLHLVPLGDAQREIVTHTHSELRTVLYRRLMLRIAEELAHQRTAKALILGDSLGQVASQTIENITAVDAAVSIQVVRPLMGMTKQEIMNDAQAIGTYDISTRKYQDCCVLFEPRWPVLRSTHEELSEAEEGLDIESLLGKSLAGIETRVFNLPAPSS